jgi:hypothetical protein
MESISYISTLRMLCTADGNAKIVPVLNQVPIWAVELYLNEFLTLALDRAECSDLRSVRYNSRERAPVATEPVWTRRRRDSPRPCRESNP